MLPEEFKKIFKLVMMWRKGNPHDFSLGLEDHVIKRHYQEKETVYAKYRDLKFQGTSGKCQKLEDRQVVLKPGCTLEPSKEIFNYIAVQTPSQINYVRISDNGTETLLFLKNTSPSLPNQDQKTGSVNKGWGGKKQTDQDGANLGKTMENLKQVNKKNNLFLMLSTQGTSGKETEGEMSHVGG